MAEEKEILQNTFYYSILKYFSYLVLIVTGLLITNALGPAGFGIFSAMMLILNYSRYSFMCLYSACFKKLSFHIGRQEHHRLQEIKDATFSPSVYISVFISLCVFISSYFLNFESEILDALKLVACLIILQNIYYFYAVYLRVDKKFNLLGWVELLFNLLRLVAVLLFIVNTGLTVMYVLTSLLLAYVVILTFIRKKEKFKISWTFSFKKAKELFWFGLPNTILGAFGTIFTSIDKLMIIRFFDRVHLGMYSFAILILEMVTFIPANIATVILPSQLERYGAYTSGEKIKNMLTMPLIIISYFLPVVIGGAFFYSKSIIFLLFPKYVASIDSLYILIFGGFFVSNLYILETFVMSINKEKKILLPKIIFICLSIVLNYLAISNGDGIYGVAIATTAIYVCYSIYLLIFSYLEFTTNLLKDTATILFPPIYCLVFLLLLNLYGTASPGTLWAFLLASIKYGIFLILNIPLWLYANKKTGILRLMVDIVRQKYTNFKYKLGI